MDILEGLKGLGIGGEGDSEGGDFLAKLLQGLDDGDQQQ